MITYLTGSIFNSSAQTLVNTVNCVGVMGAGIALECRLRFPDMFIDYKEKCNQKLINVGYVDFYKIDDTKLICNFPTKLDFRFPSRLEWIENGLTNFCLRYKDENVTSVAFPKLGASNGELDWESVNQIMVKHLSKLDIDVFICLDTNPDAEGVELEMVSRLNNENIFELGDKLKIQNKQVNAIIRSLPVRRFRDLLAIDGLGQKTYEKLFHHFYNDISSNPSFKYITLF